MVFKPGARLQPAMGPEIVLRKTLFSLLFIVIIPIDFKITIFSLHLFVYFFCNNYNIWWTHKRHKRHFKQKND